MPSILNNTGLLPVPRLLCALGLAVACFHGTGAPAQTSAAGTSQAAPSQEAPRGKVLFERHDPAPADTTGTSADLPDEVDPSITGSKPRTTAKKDPRVLHRRDEKEGAPPASGQAESTQQAPSPASSPSDAGDTQPAAALTMTTADREAAGRIGPEERTAVSITATALDLHLDSHTGDMEARAQLTLRNTGPEPLAHLPLRISGALHWESVRLQGGTAPLPLEQHRIADDLDHTGLASELAVTLGEPLQPGASVRLDLYYGGTLTASTGRLLALGAPAGRAALTDWDTVSDTFTGLRGMGNVLWYPVAGAPALLRDGDAVTRAVEFSRASNAAIGFRLRLTLQYTGSRPDAAFFCGEAKPLAPLAPLTPGSPDATEGGVVTAQWDRSLLGWHTPSLFVAGGAPQEVAGGLLRVVTDRADAAAALGEAAARLRPMMAAWLGAAPDRPLHVLDLPVPGAAGFADGGLLVAPLSTGPAALLAPSMTQPLAAAWLPDDIAAPWLREGLPVFLQAVWAEQTSGRDVALAGLSEMADTLASPAPKKQVSSSSAEDIPSGTPLSACVDSACTRGKAAYIFEMLRGMLGDAGLQQAISGWRVQEQQKSRNSRSAADETVAMENLLQQVAGKKDLHWFFAQWIDADRGLPDLAIVTVAPRRVERSAPVTYLPEAPKHVAGPIGAEPVPDTGDARHPAASETASSSNAVVPAAGSWLVAVEVQNNGGADAEVPVTVRSGNLTNTLPLHVPAHGRATIRIPFEADPTEVQVNDGSIPEARVSQHRRTIANLPAQR